MSNQHWSNAETENFWHYLNNEMSIEEKQQFEARLEYSDEFQAKFSEFRTSMETLQQWSPEKAPPWNPKSFFPVKQKRHWQSSLAMVFASMALVFSLLPYIHISDQGIAINFSGDYVSSRELDNRFSEFNLQQSLNFDDKLAQLKTEQNSTNKILVVSLLKYAEQKRRNDLLQMASWFSKQSELNNQQQRQIINWVVNEQHQDEEQINALWNSLDANQ